MAAAPSAPVAPIVHDEPRVPPPVESHPGVAPAPVASFQAVSQHDEAAPADESQRPVRRRRAPSVSEPAPVALQMVETQAASPAVPAEDEPPRRTKPRRRRAGSGAASEPLVLVETQGDSPRNEAPPTA